MRSICITAAAGPLSSALCCTPKPSLLVEFEEGTYPLAPDPRGGSTRDRQRGRECHTTQDQRSVEEDGNHSALWTTPGGLPRKGTAWSTDDQALPGTFQVEVLGQGPPLTSQWRCASFLRLRFPRDALQDYFGKSQPPNYCARRVHLCPTVAAEEAHVMLPSQATPAEVARHIRDGGEWQNTPCVPTGGNEGDMGSLRKHDCRPL